MFRTRETATFAPFGQRALGGLAVTLEVARAGAELPVRQRRQASDAVRVQGAPQLPQPAVVSHTHGWPSCKCVGVRVEGLFVLGSGQWTCPLRTAADSAVSEARDAVLYGRRGLFAVKRGPAP